MTHDDTPSTPGPVFICHASEDRDIAWRLTEALERRGVRGWFAPRDIPVGADYPASIVAGIRACAAMVVLVSAAANGKDFVRREVERAGSYGKPLTACLLDGTRPSHGLELFLSSTQWVDAGAIGIEGAAEAIAAALLGTPLATAPARRTRGLFRKALLATVMAAAVAVVIWATWPPPGPEPRRQADVPRQEAPGPSPAVEPDDPDDPDDPKEPDVPDGPGPGSGVDASDPGAVARALIEVAGTGDESAIRARFTPAMQAQYPDHLWTTMAAQARQFAPTAAAPPEIVFQRKLPRRLVPGPDQVTLVVAERRASGSWYCDQVLLRGDDARWTAELYNFWVAVDGRCLSEDDVDAATTRAGQIVAVIAGGGEIPAADISRVLAEHTSKPEWAALLANIRERIGHWSPADHLVGAAPLSNMQWPGSPGRFVVVRYAVDRGGMLLNLDVMLQQETDDVWRLAGLYLTPWTG